MWTSSNRSSTFAVRSGGARSKVPRAEGAFVRNTSWVDCNEFSRAIVSCALGGNPTVTCLRTLLDVLTTRMICDGESSIPPCKGPELNVSTHVRTDSISSGTQPGHRCSKSQRLETDAGISWAQQYRDYE